MGAALAGGEIALLNRSSTPARLRRIAPERVADGERLRWQRLSSPAITRQLAMPISTTTRIRRRLGRGGFRGLDPPNPVVRYERPHSGELAPIGSKKLGRIDGLGHRITGRRPGAVNRRHGIGWEGLHVCIDDACRLVDTEILPDERKESAIAFLEGARAWFARYGVAVERVMTDKGSADRSRTFRAACAKNGLRHIRTRPYTPRTSGKAERFTQTVLRECAYARPFPTSEERADTLPRWTHLYNVHPPHIALIGNPPIPPLAQNNLRPMNN